MSPFSVVAGAAVGRAYYVVRGPAVGDLEPLLAQLARDHRAGLPG